MIGKSYQRPVIPGRAPARTRNLEIPRCAIAHLRFGASHRPGMTVSGRCGFEFSNSHTVIASEAKQSIEPQRKYGLLRFARNDVTPIQTHIYDPATQYARVVAGSFAQRGRGERRMPVAPAASCALGSGRTHTSNNEYPGITRHSRTQWF